MRSEPAIPLAISGDVATADTIKVVDRTSGGPLPILWSADDAGAWRRRVDTLAAEWERVKDTLEPIRSGAEHRPPTWAEALPALRLGHAVSRRFPMRVWDGPLSDLIEVEWELMRPGLDWTDAHHYARAGFELGRRDQTVKFPREQP